MSITVTTNEVVEETPATSIEESGNEETESQENDENSEDSETHDDETEESEESEESEDESEESEEKEGDESEDEEPDEETKPKRKSGFKKRIDKLNNRVSDRDREIEYLRRQIEIAQQGKTNTQPQDDDTQTKTKVNENDYGLKRPVIDDYEDYNDYVEDLTDFKVELATAKGNAKREETKVNAERETRITSFQSKAKEMAVKVSDFETVLHDVDDIKVNPDLQIALLDSENGPELMYQLAKNPDEYRRVNQLSKSGIDRALGRIEARIELSQKPSPTKKVLKKSKAPKPLGKVGTKGKGTAKSINDADLSQKEYERLRNEQLRKK